MPDRSRPPRVYMPKDLDLPPVKRLVLDNGIPVYLLHQDDLEVVRMEIQVRAGRPFEEKPLVSRACLQLIKEGNADWSNARIAEVLDFRGASLSTPFHLDYSIISLHCLTSHLTQLLPLVANLLTQPLFTQTELDNYIRRSLDRLSVELEKIDVLAYRNITERIFGPDHPYGYNSDKGRFHDLSVPDLAAHHKKCYTTENTQLFLAGNIGVTEINALNRYFGSGMPIGPYLDEPPPEPRTRPEVVRLNKRREDQVAIRMGRRIGNRRQAEFHGLSVLNTVLGGYFGSRLMANIREDKGYTYNIYSSLDPQEYDGSWLIATEVGKDQAEAALNEIRKELRRLQDDLIPTYELDMVRSYLLGSFLSMLDGPFHSGDIIRSLKGENLPNDFFASAVETTRSISAAQLRELAQQYFQPDAWWVSMVW